MRAFFRQVLLSCLSIALILSTPSFLNIADPIAAAKQKTPSPKNIILMIGDGMGYNHVVAASCWQTGKKRGLIWQRFSTQVAMATHSLDKSYDPNQAWVSNTYIKTAGTDSAAAATAMACGRKTRNGIIGMDYNGVPLENILERAEELGKATGVVTSVEVSHATPAGFVAHNISRRNYSEIAREMIFDSALEVIMGAGHPFYNNNARRQEEPVSFRYVVDEDTWNRLVKGKAIGADADGDGKPDKWTLITKKKEFNRLGKGPTPKRVIGVARAHCTLQHYRSSVPGKNPNEEFPFESPLNQRVPTLATMAKGALNVLDNDPDGFVMMIEGGAIDWASHAHRTGRLIEEMMDFDQAVEAVVEWISEHSSWDETLLIVTADHETGYLTGPCEDPQPDMQIKNNGKNKLPGLSWHSTGHTNSLVPVYAEGAAAGGLISYAWNEDPFRGLYLDNTKIARYIFKILN